ncbi:DUF5693 family protein [Peptoniphilus equinus]|uniref:DUF5693 family protein n=1 Tax=Peptoniphilus equinus TaxID=3016343 RepID=A0ABY7QVS8_9FIRM|nr:DUF5693 family protein [Peptoniphilus equinus]WBW50461.1 DUF5693 family protein [Peptoniphilus equinus]
MNKSMKTTVLVAFMALGLLCTFYFVLGRYRAEVQYKGYDVVADYNQFLTLAYEDGTDPLDYFKALKEAGVTKIAMVETTIDTMRALPGSDLHTELVGRDLRITGSKAELDFIEEGLQTLKDARTMDRQSQGVLVVEGRPQDVVTHRVGAFDLDQNRVGDFGTRSSVLEYIGLGFDAAQIQAVQDAGLDVVLRPSFYARMQDPVTTMTRFMDAVKTYNPNQSWVIFAGNDFYSNRSGDDAQMIEKTFSDFLADNHMAMGLIEASNQRGHMELRGSAGFMRQDAVRKIRAFTTWDYLQNKFDYGIPMHHNGEELTNVYYRAISERNIAVVFLAPYSKDNTVITNTESYGSVLHTLSDRLGDKGYISGDVVPIGTWSPNGIAKVPVALGVVAAGILLLNLIITLPMVVNGLIALAGIGLTFIFFVLGKMTSLGNLAFNLAAITVYASLAVAFVLKCYRWIKSGDRSLIYIYLRGMLILLGAIAITMIGALSEVAFLSGTDYLMELSEFRGVKLSQILPIGFAAVLYMSYVGFGRTDKKRGLRTGEIQGVLNQDVKFWHAGLAMVMLVMVGILLLRGGNTNTEVPAFELLSRNLMEMYLPVRPRTKAILIGFPAVVAFIYMGYRRRFELFSFPAILAVAIGMADIVNTFSHIRTPVLMSFGRIGVEYVVSAVVSLIVIVILELLRKGYDAYFA